MDEQQNNIELRSEEVQEILGHVPVKIIRYGITVILSVILVLFAGSFFFRYPDILSAPVEVVSQNSPAAIVAKTPGSLTAGFVSDSQLVKTQQVLALVKNPANYDHIQWLQNKLAEIKTYPPQIVDTTWFQQLPDSLQLGEVQSSYTSLLKAGQEYSRFLQLQVIQKKVVSLQQKRVELQKYIEITKRQVALKQQDYQLSQNLFNRDSQLYVKEVLSLSDFEKSRKELIQQGMALENLRSSQVTAQMQMQDLVQEIANYELEEINQAQQYINQRQQMLQTLESQLASWMDNYLLISPIDGIVAFNKIWSQNQFVQSGNEVFTVIPTERVQIIGRITLPAKGSGKVTVGQRVNLKFENFPYQEFGMVTASVSTISLVPSEQNYMVEIHLPDTLLTNYGYLLPFTQKMLGTAEIVTEDLPLIMRLFNPLKAIFKKHWSNSPIPRQTKMEKGIRRPETEINVPVTDNDAPLKETATNNPLTKEPVYYIVAGSFTNATKAEEEKNRFTEKGYTVTILEKNQNYRIVLYSTSQKDEAFKYLEDIRIKEKNPSIWVLKEN